MKQWNKIRVKKQKWIISLYQVITQAMNRTLNEFYFGSMDESGPGLWNTILRVRRLIGTAGLRTFKLDSTTTSSATMTPAIQLNEKYSEMRKIKTMKTTLHASQPCESILIFKFWEY